VVHCTFLDLTLGGIEAVTSADILTSSNPTMFSATLLFQFLSSFLDLKQISIIVREVRRDAGYNYPSALFLYIHNSPHSFVCHSLVSPFLFRIAAAQLFG
jgi:hypothetical protein